MQYATHTRSRDMLIYDETPGYDGYLEMAMKNRVTLAHNTSNSIWHLIFLIKEHVYLLMCEWDRTATQ